MQTATRPAHTITSNGLAFRAAAIKLIGSIVHAREYAVKHNLERTHISDETRRPVREQYNAYRNTWTVAGVSGFIIRYEKNLMVMATGGRKQMESIRIMVQEAKRWIQ